MANRALRMVLLGPVLLLLAEDVLADVLMPVLKSPKPYDKVNMPYISPSQMENAFAEAQQKAQDRADLENKMPSQGGTISRGSLSAKARHQRFNAIDPQTVTISDNEATFEEAGKSLVKKFGLSKEQAAYGLGQIDMPHGSNRAKQAIQNCQRLFGTGRCNSNYKFRTADGSCNNLDQPLWGKSFTCFERLLPPDYADGLSAPRLALSGNPLPNPRVVSKFIHEDIDVKANDYTVLTMQFGQFMDHDMTLTPMTRAGPGMDMIECCQNGGSGHPACLPIEIPPDDDFFAPQGETCLNFVRSAPCASDCKLGPRQQTNQLTSFIDAGNIYGSEKNDTDALREFSGGRLRAQNLRAGELLPQSRDPNNDQCSRGQNLICFQAGDERVNEQPGLTSMHTIWLRQHNRIARYLESTHPQASDEDLFQETRGVVIAQLQMVLYGEFLPVVMGPVYMDYFKLTPLKNGYTDYDSNTQPTMLHEFATSAYRFGHTLIPNIFRQYDSNGRNSKNMLLADNFFFPFFLYNGELDGVFRGLFLDPSQQYDRHIVESVTNHLYKAREDRFGMDLPALNLQRGRDHGINGYTKYLDYCFDIQVESYSDLANLNLIPTKVLQKMSQVYESVHDIELFTAGVAETPMTNAVVGPTFGCILGVQFYHLKFGDRFYFEHKNQAGSFSINQLNEIRGTTLAKIICANSNIYQIAPNVFRPTNSYTTCDRIRELNLDYW